MGKNGRKNTVLLLICILAFIGTRLLVLFYSNQIYHDEEEFRGTAAKEWLEEKRFGVFDYQYTAYEGGSLIAYALIVPFYKVFGINVYSLKLAGLLMSLLAFIVICRLLLRYSGTLAMLLGALLMILGPPYFIKRGVMTMGDFELSMLAGLLVLTACLRIFIDDKTRKRDLFLFGLLSGLSVWIHYSSFVMVASCSFLLLFKLGQIRIKGIFVACIGAVLGLLPLILYNLEYTSAGAFRVSEGVSYHGAFFGILQQIADKFHLLVIERLPISYHFYDIAGISEKALSYTLYGIFLVSIPLAVSLVLYSAKKEKDEGKTWRLLLLAGLSYLVFYTVAYCATRYTYPIKWGNKAPQHSSYLFHFNTALFLIVPLMLAGLFQFKKGFLRISSRLLLFIFVLIVSTVGTLGLVSLLNSSPDDPNKQIGQPYSYHHMAYMFGENLSGFEEKAATIYQKMTPEERQQFARGMGFKRGNQLNDKIPSFFAKSERGHFYIGQGRTYYTDTIQRDRMGGLIKERTESLAPLDRMFYMEGVWDGASADPYLLHQPKELINDLLLPDNRIEAYRKRLYEAIGLPYFQKYSSYSPQKTGEIQLNGILIEKIVLELTLGKKQLPVRLPINLYRPAGNEKPLPTVLIIQSHNDGGKAQQHTQILCQALAQAGFLAITWDLIGYGQRESAGHEPEAMFLLQAGLSLRGQILWEATRILDYLETRSDVDSSRMGSTGFSGGGTNALYLAALDKRIRVCVPINGLYTTAVLYNNNRRHFWCNYFPEMATWFETGKLFSLIAPRPVHVIAGAHDPIFPLPGARRSVTQGQLVYCMQHNACSDLGFSILQTAHDVPLEARTLAYNWFHRYLNPEGEIIAEDAVQVLPENELACNVLQPSTMQNIVDALLPDILSPSVPGKSDKESLQYLIQFIDQDLGTSVQKISCEHLSEKKTERSFSIKLLEPLNGTDRNSLVLLLGRMTKDQRNGKTEFLQQKGYWVLQLQPTVSEDAIEEEYFQTRRRVMAGEGLIGPKTMDILQSICLANQSEKPPFAHVAIWATGWEAIPASIAAAVSTDISGLILESPAHSLIEQIYYPYKPIDTYLAPFTQPELFQAMDLSGILAVYAPRKLYLTEGTISGMAEVETLKKSLEEQVREAYSNKNHPEGFWTGPGDIDTIVGTLNQWQ